MSARLTKDRHVFEIMLVAVTVGITALLYIMGGHKAVVLNLFYLPVVLSGYYLGRSSAGILALFCALAVTVATAVDTSGFAAFSSPAMVGLALTVWAAVLGLTAILVGTLCDERAATVDELHKAYVGVVEVLSKYLQSANPKIKARSIRVAELSQMVAEEMKLSRKQIDDIRVGALLHDLGNVEITTQVLTKAVDTLEADAPEAARHTFPGTDLAYSLSSVLHGAVPLLADQDESVGESLLDDDVLQPSDVPLGAKIIRAARAYDALAMSDSGAPAGVSDEVLAELHRNGSGDSEVLDALERAVRRSAGVAAPEPALSSSA